MSLNVGSLDKGAQGGSGTGGTVANPTNIQLRVIPYEIESFSSTSTFPAAGVRALRINETDIHNLGDLNVIGGQVLQLPVGRKYFLMIPVEHNASAITVAIVATPESSGVTDWESTRTQYYNAAREGVIFSTIDLTDATQSESVVLRIQNVGGGSIDSGSISAMAMFILDISE